MKAFERKYPALYFLIVGLGGGILIVIGIDLVLFMIGGFRLQGRLGIISTVAGIVWLLPRLLRLLRN